MKVKVCGITNYKDAVMVLDHGVDVLGFNFYPPSPRYIRPADARGIIGALPPFAVAVGVFVNAGEPERVSEQARTAGVQILQLHGDETPEYCERLSNWPLIKALRIGSDGIPEGFEAYPVRGFLLDVKDDVLFGGTGKSFEWSLAKHIRRIHPVLLAGGLRPDNVREAVRIVNPYGVDVCSGVESEPGKKDAQKLIEFMNEVRNAGQSIHRT